MRVLAWYENSEGEEVSVWPDFSVIFSKSFSGTFYCHIYCRILELMILTTRLQLNRKCFILKLPLMCQNSHLLLISIRTDISVFLGQNLLSRSTFLILILSLRENLSRSRQRRLDYGCRSRVYRRPNCWGWIWFQFVTLTQRHCRLPGNLDIFKLR
jgi:hypothetical protein